LEQGGRSVNEVLSRHFLQGLQTATKHSEVMKFRNFPKTEKKFMPFSESKYVGVTGQLRLRHVT